MRCNIFLYFLLFISYETCAQLSFKEDTLKQGFESASIVMPDDYDGKVVTTLIRKTKPGNQRAVLYIHGFSDYFFQVEMAEQYLAHGYDFYALDLRKYGRSHLPHQRLFDVHKAHKEVQKGNVVYKPCLIMRSDKSVYGKQWHTDFTKGDAVLDVKDIERYGRTLGKDVKMVTIENGLHDLTLSNAAARATYYDELFSWLRITLQ